MDQAGPVDQGDDAQKGQKHLWAQLCHDRCDEGEYGHGGQLHHKAGEGIHGPGQTVKDAVERLACAAQREDSGPKRHGKKDDLEHIALGQRGDRVGGHQVEQGVGQTYGLLLGRRVRKGITQSPPHREQVARQQTQGHRHGGGTKIKEDGTRADARRLPGVPQTAGARHDGGKDQGDHQHLDQV